MGSTKTENESNTLRGSTLHSLQVKKKIIGNVIAKNYLKESCRVFCASLFKEKVLHLNSLILKFNLQYCNIAHI